MRSIRNSRDCALRWTLASIAVLGSLLALGVIDAQQLYAQKTDGSDAHRPSFEVASIKPNKSSSPMWGFHLDGDRFEATTAAFELIAWAYGQSGTPRNPAQISGGPGWIKSDVFDVEAKVDVPWFDSLFGRGWEKLSHAEQWKQAMLMLQSLLADRFKLKISHEMKDLPVYELVLAKNGAKFAEDNTHPEVGAVTALGLGKLELTSCDFGPFVSTLSAQPELQGRVLLDKTGLTGHYTFTFQWTPEVARPNGGPSADNASTSESSIPSLFTALREQLGLRIESTHAPVDVIVIENIDKPSEN
jgi:uncharacterized protein (TIGR03435 family)